MDYINVTHNDYLQDCLDYQYDFADMLQFHWKENVLCEYRGWHKRNEKTKIEENLSFIVGDDFVELSNSIVEEDPQIELLHDLGGKAKTLTLTCKFKMPSIKITGQISISNPSRPLFKSDYKLEAKNIEISSIISFIICGDGYGEDYSIHKLNNPSLSLTYLDGDKSISLLDKVIDKCTKSTVEYYILDNCLKDVYKAMTCCLLEPMYDKALCSNTVGADYSLRNEYRIHEKKLKTAFNIFVDKVLNVTNEVIEKNSPTISIPKIFKISKDVNNTSASIQIVKGILSNMNGLVREKTPIILEDSIGKVVLYAPVSLKNLKIKYHHDENIETEETFESDINLEISLKKLNEKNVQIDCLNCKVKELKPCSLHSKLNLIFDLQLLVSIKEKLKEYLILALKNTELNDYALNPPNVEIEHDEDDFIGEDSEDYSD